MEGSLPEHVVHPALVLPHVLLHGAVDPQVGGAGVCQELTSCRDRVLLIAPVGGECFMIDNIISDQRDYVLIGYSSNLRVKWGF